MGRPYHATPKHATWKPLPGCHQLHQCPSGTNYWQHTCRCSHGLPYDNRRPTLCGKDSRTPSIFVEHSGWSCPRWSEHIRELHKHSQCGLEPCKQRRRYNELLNLHSSSCFNCLILETTTITGIKAAEAKAITLISPSAKRY